jgi:uncharacterized protein (DUF952 family)
MRVFIYKLLRSREWEATKKAEEFRGSPDDLRDGFIHLSAAHQVRTTFDKYFSDEYNPILAAVDASRLGDALKWEVSRGGEKFPHLYGMLKRADMRETFEIRRDASGRPIFPPEIP